MIYTQFVQKTQMWFEREIKQYDKQLWEQTVEKGITEKINNTNSKKIVDDIFKNSINRQMIDIDLITGTTISKNKSKESFISNCRRGIFRALFPLYNNKWWISKMGIFPFMILIIFYTINLVTLFQTLLTDNSLEIKSLEFIFLLLFIFAILSMLLSHIFDQNSLVTDNTNESSKFNNPQRRNNPRTNLKVPFWKLEELNMDSSDETEDNRITPNPSVDNISSISHDQRNKFPKLKNDLMVSEIESVESESGSPVEEFNLGFDDPGEHKCFPSTVKYRNIEESVSQQSIETVGCLIKENGICTKEYLTAHEIGSIIIIRCNACPENITYIIFAFLSSLSIALLLPIHNYSMINFDQATSFKSIMDQVFGNRLIDKFITCNFILQKFSLCFYITFLLTIAERSCRQRLKYYKNFDMITSPRRSQKNGLPYFRLNSVKKVKLWLSLRSYIKKCGPLRSIRIIISFSFYVFMGLFVALGIQIKSYKSDFFQSHYSLEICGLILIFGTYLLRFITDQTQYNKAVKNGNTLLTEKFNIYQTIDQKPAKKERYLLTVQTLDVAFEIIRNVEKTFKMSMVFGNPILFSVLNVILFSVLTALLNELLGVKLRFFKIKI